MTNRKQRTVDVLNTDRVRLLKSNPEKYYQKYPIPRFGFDVSHAAKSKPRDVRK